MGLIVFVYIVTGDKTEGSHSGSRPEVRDGGQSSGGGGMKRPGQFSGEKPPDAKRKRT